jgi:hypothetical protein
LRVIKQFYLKNTDAIEKLSKSIVTKEFYDDKISTLHYPRAKIIDMFGFVYGQHI